MSGAEAQPAIAQPSFDSLSAQATDQRAIATNHMLTLNGIRDNFPNTETLAMLQKTEATLREERDAISAEMQTLEIQSAADNVVFEEKAPPLTGEPREKIYTLQDYILAILVTTFAFFFTALFFYVGKLSGWNKKTLIYMIAGGIFIIVVGYSLLRVYA